MTFYMDQQGKRLLAWMKERYAENERMGYPVEHIAHQLHWSYNQTKYAIDYVRKEVTSEDGQIVCFQRGRTWFYKLPSPDDAELYVESRGAGIAKLIANVLFLVRKGRAKWGDRPYLVSAQTHLTAALEEMGAMGVPGVDDLLAKVMRPISNGV